MNDYSISIIIPSKDRENFILNLLSDIDKQSLTAYEILIIDQSEKLYQLNSNKNIIHIIDKQRGPCHARNLGLEHSTGEIIVFLDDDIRIEPDFLFHLCSPIIDHEQYAVIGAMCDPEGKYPSSENLYWKKDYQNWILSLTANPGFPGKCPTMSFTTCCAAIHQCVYKNIGGFDPFFDPNGAGEDREYGLRIFHAGFPILYEGKAVVRHLGAPSGGRRGTGMGFKYQNILEANSVYIVAKYFGWDVFEEFCRSWLKSIIDRGKGINPRLWVRSFLWWSEALHYIKRISEIKRENDW